MLQIFNIVGPIGREIHHSTKDLTKSYKIEASAPPNGLRFTIFLRITESFDLIPYLLFGTPRTLFMTTFSVLMIHLISTTGTHSQAGKNVLAYPRISFILIKLYRLSIVLSAIATSYSNRDQINGPAIIYKFRVYKILSHIDTSLPTNISTNAIT